MTDEIVPEGILPRRETRQAKELLRNISYLRDDQTKRAHDEIEPYLLAFEASVVPLVEASEAHWAEVDAQPVVLANGTVLVPGKVYDITMPRSWRSDKARTLRARTLLRMLPPGWRREREALFSGGRNGTEVTVTGDRAATIVEVSK